MTQKINDKALSNKTTEKAKITKKTPQKVVKNLDPIKEEEKTKKKLLIEFLLSQKEKPDSRRTLNSLVEMYKDRYSKFINGLELEKFNKNLDDDNVISGYNSELEEEVNIDNVEEIIETMKENSKENKITQAEQKQDLGIVQVNDYETIINRLEVLEKLILTLDSYFLDSKKVLIIK